MASVLHPQGRLDISAAKGLHSELGALKGQDAVVDLRCVTQVGALCLQVLIAAAKTARAAGTTFRVTNPNDRVAAHLTSMGMPVATLTEDIQ